MEKLEYEIKHENLNIEKLIKDKKKFDYEMVAAHIREYRKGFKVKKISKTHRTGTRFSYIKIAGYDDGEEYFGFLTEMIREYNNKYNDEINIHKLR